MPGYGDPSSPVTTHVSPEYKEKSYEETPTPNIVTAVLADYRGYDTFGRNNRYFHRRSYLLPVAGEVETR
jgi:hypothetical protein